MQFAWELGETADIIARGTIIERSQSADGNKYWIQLDGKRRVWVEEDLLFATDDYRAEAEEVE